MGAGSSTAGIVDTGAPVPPCPLFYNFMPNPQLIPASTLPKRGTDGSLRRPKGGCAARVVPLRGLPIVSEESKRHAKKLVDDAKNKKRTRRCPADGAESQIVTAATALLSNPSVLPSLSSCFLINIAVDERGRLAPLPTDGGHGAVIDAACHGADASGSGSPSRSLLMSPRTSLVKKGFSFSLPNIPVRTPLLPGAGGSRAGSFANGARRLVQGGDNSAAADELGSQLIPTTTASVNAGSRPLGEAQPKYHSFTKAGADAGMQSALSKPVENPTSNFIVSLPSCAGLINDVLGTTPDGEQDMLSANTSVCSVLVKDSRFRKPVGLQGRENSMAAPAYPNSGVGDGDNACLPRMRRQTSRITLLRVPQRTRWFLFNDSSTHEAQVSMLLCYQVQQEKPSGSRKSLAGEEAPVVPPDTTVTTSAPIPGDLRIVCRTTPLSHTSLPRRRLKAPLESTYRSKCTYVEVRPVPVETFTAAILSPKTPAQERQLAVFKTRVASAAAVEVFVVLAPGATVYLAEGEVLGYRIDTHLIPFDKSGSMAVLGRMPTPELAYSRKKKGAGSHKKGYRHTLIFLAEAAATPVSTVPVHRSDTTAAGLAASAVSTLPKLTAGRAAKGADFIPPILTGTLNNAPLHSMGLAAFVTPPKTLTDAAGRADHATVAATAATGALLQQRLSSSAPRSETVGEGTATAVSDDADGQHHLPFRCSVRTAGGSSNAERYITEVAGSFDSCGAPATGPSTAVAALPSGSYSYSYDFADVSAELKSTVTSLAWPAAHATAARADHIKSAAGVVQLPVPNLKSLDYVDEDRSITRGDGLSECNHFDDAPTDPLGFSF